MIVSTVASVKFAAPFISGRISACWAVVVVLRYGTSLLPTVLPRRSPRDVVVKMMRQFAFAASFGNVQLLVAGMPAVPVGQL